MQLRLDPWAPEYDASLQLETDDDAEGARMTVDPRIETTDWRAIVPAQVDRAPLWVVDGVRRVELRILAGNGSGEAIFALFGGAGVGAVHLHERATIEHTRLLRLLIVGGGVSLDPVQVRAGTEHPPLVFEPLTVADNTAVAPVAGLQAAMRAAEAALAAALATGTTAVLVDGPLISPLSAKAPIVGYVKRLRKAYLPHEEMRLVTVLPVGGRTPLFLVRDTSGRFERYAWYARIAPAPALAHPMASVARLEVTAGLPRDEARALADRITSALPSLGSGQERDPRAPQNLLPIGALERHLRHRLGDPAWIRRLLLQHLAEAHEA